MYGYVPGSSPGGRLKRERPCAANDLQLYVVRQIPDALPQSEYLTIRITDSMYFLGLVRHRLASCIHVDSCPPNNL